MNRIHILILLFLSLTPIFMMASDEKDKAPKKDYLFTLTTRLGEISFILYDQTPKHKANFLRLVEEEFYDSTTFHRVINNFMIQGGDPASKPDGVAAPVPSSPAGWNDTNSVEAEILPALSHKRGAVAGARMGDGINPERRSSITQFYIVQNPTGTPHLDGAYTVYGEVLAGMDVVDAIAKERTDRAGKPYEDIRMSITVKKMSRKKIEKEFGEVY
ncbi:MAG: peptidylprolyl isomerase [Bacteroidia bacterium]